MHDAMLDDARWRAVSALIDEAYGIEGNGLLVGEGPKNDVRVLVVGLYRRGQRREDLERDYLENYHPIDERVPRFRQQPWPSSRTAMVTAMLPHIRLFVRGDRTHARRHLPAPEGDLPEAVHLAAGGPGTVGTLVLSLAEFGARSDPRR